MKELEKILEEMEQRVNYYKEHATLEYVDICAGLREAEGIIRKHMNDGWVPVEEKVPDSGIYNEIHIGFSSYKLDVVFGYLEKYFDIVNEENKSDQVQDYHSDDLISREAIIEAVDRHTREDGTLDDDITIILEEVKTAFDKGRVIEELNSERNLMYREDGTLMGARTQISIDRAVDIVEKGGIE